VQQIKICGLQLVHLIQLLENKTVWIIRNNIIPFGKFKAITIWPFIFARKNADMSPLIITHEEIHGQQ
jgi:hypothetical protein